MAERKSIETAPRDGSEVTVYWTDGDGVMNESVGKWDAGDKAWWVYTDGDTKKKVQPTSWRPASPEDDA
jgi:hypothetical protein